MVEIPGASSLGAGPSARSGRGIARMETGQVAAGAQAFAAGMQQLGQASMRLATQVAAKAQQVEAYQVQARYLDWQQQEATRYEEERRSLPANELEGYAARFMDEQGTFFERGREFMASIPERLRDEYNVRLYGFRNEQHDAANTYALDQLNKISVTTANDAAAAILGQIPAVAASPDPLGAAAILAAQLRSVTEGAPHLTQAQQAAALSAGTRSINLALINELNRTEQYDLVDQLTGNDPIAMADRIMTSAGGVGTIPDAQWVDVASDVIYAGMDPDEREVFDADPTTARSSILAARNNPEVAAEVGARILESNGRALAAAGVEATPANLMLAQQLGMQAAVVIALRAEASPDTLVSDVIAASVIAGSEIAGMTVGDAAEWANRTVTATEAYGHRMAPGLTVEDRAAAIADSTRGRNAAAMQAAAQQEAQRAALLNDLLVRLHDGTAGMTQINAAREAGWLTEFEDIKKAEQAYGDRNGEMDALNLVRNGGVPPDDTATINAASTAAGIVPSSVIHPDTPWTDTWALDRNEDGQLVRPPWGMPTAEAEAERQRIISTSAGIFERTGGGISTDLREQIEGAMTSGSPAAIGQTFELMDRMAEQPNGIAQIEEALGSGQAADLYTVWRVLGDLPGITSRQRMNLLFTIGSNTVAVQGLLNADGAAMRLTLETIAFVNDPANPGNRKLIGEVTPVFEDAVEAGFGGALANQGAYLAAIMQTAFFHYAGSQRAGGKPPGYDPDTEQNVAQMNASVLAVTGGASREINGVMTFLPPGSGVNADRIELFLDDPDMETLVAASPGGRWEFFNDIDIDLDQAFFVRDGAAATNTYFVRTPDVNGQMRFVIGEDGEKIRVDLNELTDILAEYDAAVARGEDVAIGERRRADRAAGAIVTEAEEGLAAPTVEEAVTLPADLTDLLPPAIDNLQAFDWDFVVGELGVDLNDRAQVLRALEGIAVHYGTDIMDIADRLGIVIPDEAP